LKEEVYVAGREGEEAGGCGWGLGGLILGRHVEILVSGKSLGVSMYGHYRLVVVASVSILWSS
jgi:hypothetical protein